MQDDLLRMGGRMTPDEMNAYNIRIIRRLLSMRG